MTVVPFLDQPDPVEILVNGQPRQIREGTTITQLLAELKLPPRGIAVEVNQAIVPRIRHAEQLLCNGDRLEVVSLVGGG